MESIGVALLAVVVVAVYWAGWRCYREAQRRRRFRNDQRFRDGIRTRSAVERDVAWLRETAPPEGDGFVSVGGWVTDLERESRKFDAAAAWASVYPLGALTEGREPIDPAITRGGLD